MSGNYNGKCRYEGCISSGTVRLIQISREHSFRELYVNTDIKSAYPQGSLWNSMVNTDIKRTYTHENFLC